MAGTFRAIFPRDGEIGTIVGDADARTLQAKMREEAEQGSGDEADELGHAADWIDRYREGSNFAAETCRVIVGFVNAHDSEEWVTKSLRDARGVLAAQAESKPDVPEPREIGDF
ncbi:MAG: hypothetical protein WBB76_04850 [Gaiellaceae bacterium]